MINIERCYCSQQEDERTASEGESGWYQFYHLRSLYEGSSNSKDRAMIEQKCGSWICCKSTCGDSLYMHEARRA